MLERIITNNDPYKGRIIDPDIAHELALYDQSLREELGGKPIFSAETELGKPEVRYREVVNYELRLILHSTLDRELDGFINTPDAKATDLEENSEPHLVVRLANTLFGYENYGFDEETCKEILELPYPEAFETVYSYLVQAGLDADEILKEFTE